MSYQKGHLNLSRRHFITRVLPACSLVSLGASSSLLGFPYPNAKSLQEAKHKFDEEIPMKFTNRQLATTLFTRDYIPFLKLMSEELGEERLIKLLKEHTAEKSLETGKRMAKQFGGNDFPTLKKIFDPESAAVNNTLTFTVTENAEKVYELNVTECLMASVFLKANAGEFGWASVCYGDYAMAKGFNPKISLVRDKTLMQGHACCNHRYLLEG